jgi:sugar transferase EpsL
MHRSRKKGWIKRFFDISLIIPTALFWLPVIGLLALLVRFKLGMPVFFCQTRPGLSGKPFTIYKFRTMTDCRDEKGRLLPDEQRLTTFGRFMRRTSIDELPELFNVLIGDMSLVGPRPLLIEYLNRYTPEQARRHQMKPGITGWAQIKGRNAISWDEKFELDVWYIDNWSPWLDIKIALITFLKVLRQEGISSHGHVTMPEFMGNRTYTNMAGSDK